MQQYTIGIDIGTGSTKAVAINHFGKVLSVSQFYYSYLETHQGYAEQDTALIWKAFINAVKKITVEFGHAPAAISLSSAMHSLLLIDKNDKALTNLITWADTRSEAIADELRQSPQAKNIYNATGTPIHSMSPLCKIIWFKKNAPAVFERASKFISIKEFIWHKLFGKYQVDYSIASATGLFNIHTLQWNKESLLLCGINAENLSAIVSTTYSAKNVTPEVADAAGLSADTIFCIGSSDGCLANVGSNAINPGIAALTIGTSGAVRITNASPIADFSSMTFNYVLDEKTFICGGPVNNGGNVVKWLFKSFLDNCLPTNQDYQKLFETVDTISAGCNGLLFLPYLHGERAPVWDEKASAIFFGIKDHHTQSHFLRAVLEGICFSLNNILQILESVTEPVVQINVSGGFTSSKTWIQILADITGRKICMPQVDDASAIGAAIFYLKAANLFESSSAFQPEASTFIFPNIDNYQVYKKYSGIFTKLYLPLKESMHQLHHLNS